MSGSTKHPAIEIAGEALVAIGAVVGGTYNATCALDPSMKCGVKASESSEKAK